MTTEEQLDKWLAGDSIHNYEEDECCPDFSCCDIKLLADKRTREVFCTSNDEIRHQMLMIFLGNMIASITDKEVYVTGDSDTGGLEH